MTRKDAMQYLASAGMACLIVVVLVSLDQYGRASRKSGNGYPVNDPRLSRASIDYPEEAYVLWLKEKFRGRTVVTLSRRLNFVSNETPIPDMTFPLDVHTRLLESRLKNENFLVVSLEAGVARRIIQVTPEAVFQEKLRFARTAEGVGVTEGAIEAPYFGSPRTITTPLFFKAPDEPVLLYINASVFHDYEPEDVLSFLLKSGIQSDFLVLCASRDDRAVSDAQRMKLKRFGLLLGGTHGRA